MGKPAEWFGQLIARVTDPFRREGSAWLVVAFILIATPVGLFAAYQKWGAEIFGGSRYQIVAESLDVTPPQPTWIYGNVKAEVIRDGGLEELSALDTGLTPRMIDAFELHPWVESVVSLHKEHPNRVRVQLRYRRPVAMVEVVEGETRWISPVDRFGYVLPTDGFTNQLDSPDDYLRIYVGQQLAPGVAGTLWPDVRIRDGAAVAAIFREKWKQLGLYRVVALPTAGDFRTPQFALATRDRVPVVWGSAPGEEERGEPSAADKVTRLGEFIAENGSLDGVPANRLLDLRQEGIVLVEPRTARAP